MWADWLRDECCAMGGVRSVVYDKWCGRALWEAAAAQPTRIRVIAPSGVSVYCVCHTKRRCRPAGDNPRRRRLASATQRTIGAAAPRRLCVLHLPRKMSCVRWVVCEIKEMSCGWDEWCEMSEERRGAEPDDADDADGGMQPKKTRTSQWCGEWYVNFKYLLS